MIKALYVIIFLACSFTGMAQYNVRINVSGKFSATDALRIAGSFNGWNPADSALQPFFIDDNTAQFTLAGVSGQLEFKFTRGGWDKVESTSTGTDIPNRLLSVISDTVVKYSIAEWKDSFNKTPKVSTASANVHIIDTAFLISTLGRTRRLWIYLPPGYDKGARRFPVIYMHDGQNLFDVTTASFGEWGIDEILDSLNAAGKPPAIVVGIDNGPKRLNEYNPFYFERAGEGEGDKYLDFITKELKPFIDKHYRTLRSKENTVIAGSSMGGLISYYAALKYKDVFGRTGVFSPAFWTAPQMLNVTDSLAPSSRGMFFFYMGEQEGEQAMTDMYKIIDKLGATSHALLYTVTDPDGRHNEVAWRKWFTEFYLWVTSNGLNHIIR